MKTFIPFLLAALLTLQTSAWAAPLTLKEGHFKEDFDGTTRFIFYSVLEGLYEDGVSNGDVNQILLKRENESYFHFIYACPVCTSTIWALQRYRSRPEDFYSLKTDASTFGPSLSKDLRIQLYSDNPHQRLTAINSLVKKWMTQRMDQMNLSGKARRNLEKELEKKRQAGMDGLKAFRRHEHGEKAGPEVMAPAYVDLDECAVCNGAVGKVMKLPDPKPK